MSNTNKNRRHRKIKKNIITKRLRRSQPRLTKIYFVRNLISTAASQSQSISGSMYSLFFNFFPLEELLN